MIRLRLDFSRFIITLTVGPTGPTYQAGASSGDSFLRCHAVWAAFRWALLGCMLRRMVVMDSSDGAICQAAVGT